MHQAAAIAVASLALACSPDKPEDATPDAPLRIGAVMMETGRRFELAGRAATAARWELAEYETHEILEVFEGDMPRALLPGECDDALADRSYERLRTAELPALRASAGARDADAFAAGYARASGSCNGCHAACRVAFVEVPSVPGHDVPRLEPAADR